MPEHEPEFYEETDAPLWQSQAAAQVPITRELFEESRAFNEAWSREVARLTQELALSFTDPEAYQKLVDDRAWERAVAFAALDEKDQRIVVLEHERDTLLIQLENLRFAVREALEAAEDYDPWS